jgi:hypothetical protein
MFARTRFLFDSVLLSMLPSRRIAQKKTPGESRAFQRAFVPLHFYFFMTNALFF